MKVKALILIFLVASILQGCTKEYDCADPQIQPAFIGFSVSDLDTVILKRFKANDNYQTMTDTFRLIYGYTSQLFAAHDTLAVFATDGIHGIRAGSDWQIYIPAKNRTIAISDIASEKQTGKYNYGIFSMDKVGLTCTNRIFSVKRDNQIISFPAIEFTPYYMYIR